MLLWWTGHDISLHIQTYLEITYLLQSFVIGIWSLNLLRADLEMFSCTEKCVRIAFCEIWNTATEMFHVKDTAVSRERLLCVLNSERIMFSKVCDYCETVFVLNEFIPLCYLNIYFITICFRQHNWHLKYNINATCFDFWQSSSGWSKNRLTFYRFYFVHFGSHMPYTV